ncbi:nucleoside 2-deoxyribosyltransferase [Marinilactibacillus psychrotolerans]|uniref:Nucleoside 2-deoxyribosyltransferase n=1 Tax=Marinilactibacillus psychrotolerans TaxID=191770 RepID=A0AAV3WR41_9LACT|nr:nucleoside 2-deoxyribosyltransferase [Marinilactibacillus psychrotolerans]GEL66741.1 nucleoside 2-deoxyribosyltransferase [Marinilactibacillus psychrotolerans]GEQ35812.1 nucleoside 2-deoxyribosyltransferase [Marinilactibacillus psychrotolerans]SDC32348.1 Nucleoside 2-deoxyribosyltransferase [Marinilactibacillus psychrotolerans]
MKKIYLGGPLFSEMEASYNKLLANEIRKKLKVEVYNPVENEAINDKSGYADSIMIAEGDNAHLEASDILVALLDGPVVDPGLAAEIGYFYSMNKPIIALYTDSRQGSFGNQQKIDAIDDIAESQFSYVNLYIVGLIKKRGFVLDSKEKLLNKLEEILTN